MEPRQLLFLQIIYQVLILKQVLKAQQKIMYLLTLLLLVFLMMHILQQQMDILYLVQTIEQIMNLH